MCLSIYYSLDFSLRILGKPVTNLKKFEGRYNDNNNNDRTNSPQNPTNGKEAQEFTDLCAFLFKFESFPACFPDDLSLTSFFLLFFLYPINFNNRRLCSGSILYSHTVGLLIAGPLSRQGRTKAYSCWPTIRPSFVLVSFIIFDTYAGGGGSTIIWRAWHAHAGGIRKISTDRIIKRLQSVYPRKKRTIKSVVKHCQTAFRKRCVAKIVSLEQNVCLLKMQYGKTVH